MTPQSYADLIGYKKWADQGLYEVVESSFDRLDAEDSGNLLRILDHIAVVDRIFQHHLQGLPNPFTAPRSSGRPDLLTLIEKSVEVDEWYERYVSGLSAQELQECVEFTFTSGKPARMTRGEILVHVCLHGTYHRGNAGVVLLKNGIKPNEDRMTDYLELAA